MFGSVLLAVDVTGKITEGRGGDGHPCLYWQLELWCQLSLIEPSSSM